MKYEEPKLELVKKSTDASEDIITTSLINGGNGDGEDLNWGW